MKIAIDGPAGAGKSTVARAVAARLGLTYVDTGAMYRAAALACIRAGVTESDPEAVAAVLSGSDIRLRATESGRPQVLLNGEDVTEAIRSPEVTRLASPLSALPIVRRALVSQQRSIADQTDVVMEGRDIGTVVLPDADVKVFLTASPRIRALRRCRDLQAAGYPADPGIVEKEIVERDQRDSSRADSPLRQAEDAVRIESDDLTVEEVVDLIVRMTGGRSPE
jgi:cytidylate kinase